MSDPEICVICDESLSEGPHTKKLKQRGIKILINKSKLRDDDKWHSLQKLTELEVHEPCRVSYCKIQKVEDNGDAEVEVPVERSFDFKQHCFLCSKKCYSGKKYPFRVVSSRQLQESIENCIATRGSDDEWAQRVKKVIDSTRLQDVGGRYHMSCYSKFVWIPENSTPAKSKNPAQEAALQKVWKYMSDNEEIQFFVEDLVKKMGKKSVSLPIFKEKLMRQYKDEVIMIEKKGKPTVVSFRNAAYKILVKAHKKRAAEEAERARKEAEDEEEEEEEEDEESSDEGDDSDDEPSTSKRARRDSDSE